MSLAPIPPHVLDAERRFQASRRQLPGAVGTVRRRPGRAARWPRLRGRRAGAQAPGPYPDRDFRQLDSWIVIRPDNSVTLFAGKTDLGQGTGTAFRQLLADELDVAFAQTSVVMGSTDVTVDQGGSGGSDALQVDGWPMRRVAAEARRVLLDMAAPRLGVPAAELTVRDGVVSTRATPPATVTYGELIGGRRFNVTLEGRNVDATSGQARVKPVSALRHVGQSPPRYDIPAKVDGSLTWAVDVTLPGMVHARNVKPPMAGATLVSVDEASVRGLPGFVRVVSRGNYVAVVFEREEQAIRGARQLKCEWRPPATAPLPDFGTALRLHAGGDADVERHADRGRRSRGRAARRGDDRRGALRGPVPGPHRDRPGARHRRSHRRPADHLLERHEVVRPAQRRRRVPADAARSRSRGVDGRSAGLRAHRRRRRRLRGGVAGHRDSAGRCGCSGCATKKRRGTPRARPTPSTMRGGLDAAGRLVALDYDARAADHNHLGYNEHDTVLVAQLTGQRKATPARGRASTPSDMYAVPHRRQTTHVVSLPLVWETPVRTGNLRDPDGPQVTFASESFIDELAAAAKADPAAFRRQLLTGATEDDGGFRRARSIAVLDAALKAYGLGRPAVAEAAGRRRRPHRPRAGLRLPQPDRGRADRRGRGQPAHRAGVGQADRLRPRLRPGHQSRGAAPHDRVRHAALAQPRPPRGGALRHAEGDQRRLDSARRR